MPNEHLKKIHIVFKTHLDIGFTDFAKNVKEEYFSCHFPKAIELAETLRNAGGKERFIWTTGSWLIYEFLKQANYENRRRMEEAIMRGDITWHGLPFTTHSELMDPSLFKFGLSLSQELDRRFGKKTIAAKMTDVPGHTMGIVGLLARAGIRFLHIGVNAASTPPDVPLAFIWRGADGSEVIVIYQKGGYGSFTALNGMSSALLFDHTRDNLGPQTLEQIVDLFRQLRERYPKVKVMASTLDAFANDILNSKVELPVITEEIGDTWIHGVGTDPTKVRKFRELCRLRNEWEINGTAKDMQKEFSKFSRFLLVIPEHTWGLDEKTYLADYENYSATQFAKARKKENFKKFEASWKEQREYINQALSALGSSGVAKQVRKRLIETEPYIPDKKGFKRVDDMRGLFDTTHFIVGFDPGHGGIIHLMDKKTKHNWSGNRNHLAKFTYEIFSQKDYEQFLKQYQYPKGKCDWFFKYFSKQSIELASTSHESWHPDVKERCDWFYKDFSKPGIEKASKVHNSWYPKLIRMWLREDNLGTHFILELTTPRDSSEFFGCPERLFLEVDLPENDEVILFNFQWFEKNACRLPEALWLSFCPRISDPKGWRMDKLGELISPLEVIRNGNRKLHAVGNGVEYHGEEGGLIIETLDAPLVAPGEMSLLNFNNRQPPMKRGMHFNLYNNIWGTNFPMWFEEDARFRFLLRFTI